MFGWISSFAVNIAASAAIFWSGRVWESFLKPAIQSFWYSGERLGSCYIGEFVLKGQKVNDLIQLKQRAHRVWGTMTFPHGRQGAYEFEATFENNVLRGTYDGLRMNRRAPAAFLLILVHGRHELHGWVVEPLEGEVQEWQYKWTPKTS